MLLTPPGSIFLQILNQKSLIKIKKNISENPDRLTVDGEKRRLGLFGWFLEVIFENFVENFELKFCTNLNFESFFLKQL